MESQSQNTELDRLGTHLLKILNYIDYLIHLIYHLIYLITKDFLWKFSLKILH